MPSSVIATVAADMRPMTTVATKTGLLFEDERLPTAQSNGKHNSIVGVCPKLISKMRFIDDMHRSARCGFFFLT